MSGENWKPEPGPAAGPSPGPGRIPNPASGAGSRLINRHGYSVAVIDQYEQYVGDDDLGNPLYDSMFFLRGYSSAITKTGDDFTREWLLRGATVLGEALIFFPASGPDEEVVIRGTGTADGKTTVPPDERLPNGKDPAMDRYSNSMIYVSRNERWYEAVTVEVEATEIRRVQASLRDTPVNVQDRPIQIPELFDDLPGVVGL